MPTLLRILLLAAIAAGPASAGTITGIVQGHGPVPPSSASGDDGYGKMRYKFAEKVDYAKLQDFVVSIDQEVPGAPAPGTQVMTQHNVAFEPHVLVVAVGTRVSWPNADEIYHNVYSMSDAKAFDLGLKSNEDKPEVKTFDVVGRVDVFCSIHSRMHGIILVVPSPYFAKVDARRRYRIEHVPAGTYRLKAWHERLPAQTRTITVPAGDGVVTADFDLGLAPLPKG